VDCHSRQTSLAMTNRCSLASRPQCASPGSGATNGGPNKPDLQDGSHGVRVSPYIGGRPQETILRP
jgi:hypothetical protein